MDEFVIDRPNWSLTRLVPIAPTSAKDGVTLLVTDREGRGQITLGVHLSHADLLRLQGWLTMVLREGEPTAPPQDAVVLYAYRHNTSGWMTGSVARREDLQVVAPDNLSEYTAVWTVDGRSWFPLKD